MTQSLVTKKIHATSWDKKIHTTSWDKRNHATSWDQKNHAIFWDKKNHATSWDKRNTQQLSKWDNLVLIGPNCFKWFQIGPNESI